MVNADTASVRNRPPGRPTVLWDFDGTLVAREGNWRAALLTALDRVAADHGVTLELLREGLRDGFPWHRPDVAHPQLHTPEVWWRDLDATLRRAYLVAGIDERTAGRAAAQVRDVYVDVRYWSVFDDTRPALRRLRDGGYRNVIVQQPRPRDSAISFVRPRPLGDLIDAVLTSAVTGYEKPHPAMFRAGPRAGRPPRPGVDGRRQPDRRRRLEPTAVGIPASPGPSLGAESRRHLGAGRGRRSRSSLASAGPRRPS